MKYFYILFIIISINETIAQKIIYAQPITQEDKVIFQKAISVLKKRENLTIKTPTKCKVSNTGVGQIIDLDLSESKNNDPMNTETFTGVIIKGDDGPVVIICKKGEMGAQGLVFKVNYTFNFKNNSTYNLTTFSVSDGHYGYSIYENDKELKMFNNY